MRLATLRKKRKSLGNMLPQTVSIYLFIYDYWAVSTAGVPRKKKGITVLGTIIY